MYSSVVNHLLFCNHSASYDDFSILKRESKKILLELKESLFIMRDKPSLNRNISTIYLFDRPSNKIFVRMLFTFNSCYVILIEWTFYYSVMSKCMSTTVCVNGTVQFTFFFVMSLNITIVTSCDGNTFTLIFSPLKLENELKKHVRNVGETKYGFVELIVIFLLFRRCDCVIPSLMVLLSFDVHYFINLWGRGTVVSIVSSSQHLKIYNNEQGDCSSYIVTGKVIIC